MERKLRVSSFLDYVAIDLVKDGIILDTPFYLKKGEYKDGLIYKDPDDGYLKTSVYINDDFTALKCKDHTGFEWESEFSELADDTIFTKL